MAGEEGVGDHSFSGTGALVDLWKDKRATERQ